MRLKALVVNSWIHALINQILKVFWRFIAGNRKFNNPVGIGRLRCRDLIKAEGKQIHYRCSARKGLGNFTHKLKLL